MEKELVSVIVLTYKKFENLEKCLNSVFMQDYPNIELIISDDGSPNFDRGLIEKLLIQKEKNIKEIKIINHENNVGTVKNYNNAIKKSKGKYIIGLAQDDCYISSNIITNLVDNFGDNLIVNASSKWMNNLKIKNNYVELYKYLIYNGNIISGSSTYYKREIFEKYGYFDEDMLLLEDFPFFLRLLRNNKEIKFLTFNTISYGMEGISTAQYKNKQLLKDSIVLFEREKIYNKGYVLRYLNFLQEYLKNEIEERGKYRVYLKYPDVFLFRAYRFFGGK